MEDLANVTRCNRALIGSLIPIMGSCFEAWYKTSQPDLNTSTAVYWVPLMQGKHLGFRKGANSIQQHRTNTMSKHILSSSLRRGLTGIRPDKPNKDTVTRNHSFHEGKHAVESARLRAPKDWRKAYFAPFEEFAAIEACLRSNTRKTRHLHSSFFSLAAQSGGIGNAAQRGSRGVRGHSFRSARKTQSEGFTTSDMAGRGKNFTFWRSYEPIRTATFTLILSHSIAGAWAQQCLWEGCTEGGFAGRRIVENALLLAAGNRRKTKSTLATSRYGI